MTTALIWDERYSTHDLGKQQYVFENGAQMDSGLSFENPERIKLVYELLQNAGFLNKMKQFLPYAATEADLLKVHSSTMIDKVKKQQNTKVITQVGEAALMSDGSYDAALLSAGGAMKAIDVLFQEEAVKQSYALIRPPGHHATRNSPMGFCLFNNVAVAATHAKDTFGAEKVLILDWDVHHGNGTQDIFYEDPSVCFISIHQDKNYPLIGGEISETGKNEGKGFNINIPLIPGCGDHEYIRVVEEIVAPVVQSFKPDLILVSAGQDPNLYDPLSRMMVTRNGFRMMMEKMRELATIHCDGKLAVFQEGGYSLPYFPIATLGVVEGLLNESFLWQADIEMIVPFNGFNLNIDNILDDVKKAFPNVF